MQKKSFKNMLAYFSVGEKILWIVSAVLISTTFAIFDRNNYLVLVSSLIGVTSLIFNAKGNPVGQILMIAFSVTYGIISYTFAYYGEMITYLCMTAPMAVFALVSWLKNPFNGNKSEVRVAIVAKKDVIFMFVVAAAITVLFYFVLKFFDTANLLPSTISVTTSFIAVYLTFKRTPFYAIAYAANDLVLIVLWIFATIQNISYLSVVICFALFFINDIYGFISWNRMKKRQKTAANSSETTV